MGKMIVEHILESESKQLDYQPFYTEVLLALAEKITEMLFEEVEL